MGIIEILNGGCQEPGRTFLVIGGFAVCAHGYDRQTVDLDILISKEQREVTLSISVLIVVTRNGYWRKTNNLSLI